MELVSSGELCVAVGVLEVCQSGIYRIGELLAVTGYEPRLELGEGDA